MDNLINGLSQMFLGLKVVTLVNNPQAVLVFSVGCAIVGAFTVVLDLSLYFLRGQSILKLNHGKLSFFFLIAWSFGAFIIGWVGQLSNIFLVSLSACVFVGVAWPVVFTKILKMAEESQSQKEPIQNAKEEM
jgi:hypothetical protein